MWICGDSRKFPFIQQALLPLVNLEGLIKEMARIDRLVQIQMQVPEFMVELILMFQALG